MIEKAKTSKSKTTKPTAASPKKTSAKKSARHPSPYRAAITAALEGKTSTFTFATETEKKKEAYKAWTARRSLGASKTVGVSMATEDKVVIGPYAVVNAATEKKAIKKAAPKATQADVKKSLHAAGVGGLGKARAKKASSSRKVAGKTAVA
jgi:hypothetical protein